MKIIYIEAQAEDLSANRTVADALIDTITRVCEGMGLDKLSGAYEDTEEDEEKEDEGE